MSTGPATAAEVAVSLPVHGTFHYLVPANLADKLAPGSRVLVPFGRRLVTGYVLNLAPPEELVRPGLELKKIIRPLDDEPLFGPDLISLFRFTARYYHHPLGQVVAEALPAGLKTMSRRTAWLTPAGKEVLNQCGTLSRVEADLLARFDRPQGVAVDRLIRKGRQARYFSRFEAEGWVVVESRLHQDRVRSLTERWLTPVAGEIESLVRLGNREKEILSLLATSGSVCLRELSQHFPALAAVARRLEKKGRIKIEERQVYRDSLGRAIAYENRPPVLTEEQVAAAASLTAALERRTFSPFVLHGVTGSGKTEVYLAAAAESLARGRTVLILVPEISLTPVLEGRLRARFEEEVGVLHSGLSDGERYDEWLKIKRREVRLVLGARSAVFAPLEDLGLIVVDEEHDGAYKQDEGLHYNARDLAVYRARQASALVILGSATPSLETFHAARSGRYKMLRLTSRFGHGRLPRIDVVDMRLDTGRRRPVLTPIMKKALADALERKEQALLFINRRGTAGLAICMSCGQVVKCLNCSVTLTLHQSALEAPTPAGPDKGRLNCHYCGFEIEPPRRCQACGTGRIIYLGIGTERLEKEVQKAFPEARVGRLDADTARPKGELTRILTCLRDQEMDVLVGTQMITKGHDFPNITLVGVIEADLGLHRPDFRAGERTFQLLAQVSGRAGRGEAPGRVIVQTYTPEHYTLLLAEKHDYLGFFEEELAQRRELDYPPFSRLALARFQANSEAQARDKAEESAAFGRELIGSGRTPEVEMLGPAPAPLSKVKGKHRVQILIRAAKVQALQRFLDQWLNKIQLRLKGQAVSVSIDVDPYQMM